MQNATNRRGALAALAKATAGVTALGVACSVSQCASPAHGATIDRAAWNRAKLEYESRALLQDAVEKFGYFHEATSDLADAKFQLNHVRRNGRVGADIKSRPDLAKERGVVDRASKALDVAGGRWLRECVTPTEKAAQTLLLTPAPDIEAVQFKASVIERHELYNLLSTPRDCVLVLQEDLSRLGGLN